MMAGIAEKVLDNIASTGVVQRNGDYIGKTGCCIAGNATRRKSGKLIGSDREPGKFRYVQMPGGRAQTAGRTDEAGGGDAEYPQSQDQQHDG